MPDKPKSIPYGTLNQKSPDYNEFNIKKLELLYGGSYELLDNARLFIHQEPSESLIAYNARLKCADYRNYFAKIINEFVAGLFSKSLSVIPAADSSDTATPGDSIDLGSDFYREFASDADTKDNSLADVLRDVITESMKCGRSYLGIDFPASDLVPTSLAEEEQLGTDRAYVYNIPTLSVIDWHQDQLGKYKWIILRKELTERQSVLSKRDTKIIQFKVWQSDSSVISYATYQIECKQGREPKPNDPCIEIDSGISSFKEIPVVCMEMPDQLFIGGLIGNLAESYFKRYSSLIHAQNKNLFATLVYSQGPELPASGDLNERQSDPNRGNVAARQAQMRNAVVIGSGDKMEYIEPSGSSYELVNTELKETIDEMHRVTSQMATSVSAQAQTQAKSGLSKIMDDRSKELVLTAYGDLVKKFALKIYNIVAEARNENIVWQALGMDDFKIVDRAIILQEAATINLIRSVAPSKTWIKHQANRIINELESGNLTPEVQLTIKSEIDAIFDKMSDEDIMTLGQPKQDDSDSNSNKQGSKKGESQPNRK